LFFAKAEFIPPLLRRKFNCRYKGSVVMIIISFFMNCFFVSSLFAMSQSDSKEVAPSTLITGWYSMKDPEPTVFNSEYDISTNPMHQKATSPAESKVSDADILSGYSICMKKDYEDRYSCVKPIDCNLAKK